MAGWTTAPRDASPHPCVSVFICSLALFLTAGWPPPTDSLLSGFWEVFPLYIPWPTFFPLSLLPCPPLGTETGLSLHLAGLSFSPLSAPVPLPTYLASRTQGLALHASAALSPADAPVWEYLLTEAVFLSLFPRLPTAECTLTSQSYLRPFSPLRFHRCVQGFSLCMPSSLHSWICGVFTCIVSGG